MSYKNSIELNILSVRAGRGVPNKANEVVASVVAQIQAGKRSRLLMGPKASMKTVAKQLESLGHAVRSGVSGGCYGARDGKSYDGLTVWVDASQFPDRFIDLEGDEVVNPYALIEAFSGELLEGMDGDAFVEACEDLGLEVSRNNTYNYDGSDGVFFLVDMDYAVVEGQEDVCFLVVKFHCGGDIRGNYTERVVFKFSSIDDLYGVLYPTAELKEQGEES